MVAWSSAILMKRYFHKPHDVGLNAEVTVIVLLSLHSDFQIRYPDNSAKKAQVDIVRSE
jgi:hypothetical protein